jgi:hypothetical protein
VCKLSADGSTLLYSTFLGGNAYDYVQALAVDSSQQVYVTGTTQSADFPTTPGANDTSYNGGDDVFVCKLSADGSALLYSTFLGGKFGEFSRALAVDSSQQVYVTGEAWSADFPTTPGANDTWPNGGGDVFVCKLSADGSTLLYSTFLGGNAHEGGYALAVDNSQQVYVTGTTQSADFPTTPGANDTSYNGDGDVFVFKLSADGSILLYSTFLGGNAYDYVQALAVDSSQQVYVTGTTQSADFPTTSGANDTSYNGDGDVFVCKLAITHPPVVRITSPGNFTYCQNSVTVTYSIYGGTPTVYLDGEANTSAIPSGFQWLGLSEGYHNITILARDTAGNVVKVSVVFTVDTSAPVITIASPGNFTYTQANVSIIYSVSEANTTVYLDGVANTSAIPSGFQWLGLSEGYHNITIVALEPCGRSHMAKVSVVFTVAFDTSVTLDSSITSAVSSAFEGLATFLSMCGVGVVLSILRKRERTNK